MAKVRCFVSVFVIVFMTILSWTVVIMMDFYSGHGKSLTPHKLSDKPPFPGGKMNNLFWIVQVSDIHISKFRDPSRQEDLKVFCDKYIDIIKPVAVLVTGDIVDAKDKFQIGSEQYVEEWKIYQKVLKESGVAKKTEWLDVRGNHDDFDVPSLNSELNMFRKYSMSAAHAERRDSKSYQVVYETKFGKYSLNGVDPSLDPGPKRPFNFFGRFSEEDLYHLEKLVENSRNHNLSIWFGHYPLSTVSGHFSYGRNLLKYGDVYLCGHLHTLGNLMPQMHAVHRDGHLELELGDWKDNRRYRILAVDHDLISFSDVTFNKWPVVVITNPKDAHYGIKTHEPLKRIRKSTHIRLLVFSPHDITSVRVSIDDTPLSSDVEHVDGSLYVCVWQPDLYSSGLHRITVLATDAHGNSVQSTRTFSIDGSRPILKLLPAMILLTDGQTLIRVLYFVSFLFIVCGPALVKYFLLDKTAVLRALSIPNGLRELAKTDTIFYPLFLYGLYTAIGPWLVAELTTGHIGVVFLHGLYLKGKWIPEPTVYAFGIFQNLLFQLPLTTYLASYLGQKISGTSSFSNGTSKSRPAVKDEHKWGFCWFVFMTGILFLTFLLQLYGSVSFWQAYGFMAFVFSPVKTWSLVLLIFLIIITCMDSDTTIYMSFEANSFIYLRCKISPKLK